MAQTTTPLHVLIIDDDEMSRELLTALFEAEEFTVQCAESGETALSTLRDNPVSPAIVLTDLQLPGISGSELAEQLRAACSSDNLLLAMSGSQPPQQQIAKFDGFLLKPLLVEKVSEALASRKRVASGSQAGESSEKNVAAISPSTSESEAASNRSMYIAVEAQMQPAFSAAPDVPALNETIYRQLTGTVPTSQLHEMYALCLKDARDRITSMRASIAAHDSAQFVRQAHAIKGSCGMLGATELHGMAAELEKTGLAPSDSHSQQDVNSLDELSAACDRLEGMLRSRV